MKWAAVPLAVALAPVHPQFAASQPVRRAYGVLVLLGCAVFAAWLARLDPPGCAMGGREASSELLARPGGAIAYDVTGSGPLVVCIPGMGELRSSYRYTVPALRQAGLRVACMDLRGHGDSDATFDRYDDVAAGEDAVALADHLGASQIVLVGNSMGAGAAVWAAAERPELVAGIALLGPFVRNTPMNPLLVLAFRLAMSGPWAPRVWASYVPRLYPGRRPADFEEHLSAITATMRRPGHARAFIATTRSSHQPAESRLADVKCPALVVMGERDPDFPDPAAEAAWVAGRLDAPTILVPAAGHYPQAEDPDVVNPALSVFCRQVLDGGVDRTAAPRPRAAGAEEVGIVAAFATWGYAAGSTSGRASCWPWPCPRSPSRSGAGSTSGSRGPRGTTASGPGARGPRRPPRWPGGAVGTPRLAGGLIALSVAYHAELYLHGGRLLAARSASPRRTPATGHEVSS